MEVLLRVKLGSVVHRDSEMVDRCLAQPPRSNETPKKKKRGKLNPEHKVGKSPFTQVVHLKLGETDHSGFSMPISSPVIRTATNVVPFKFVLIPRSNIKRGERGSLLLPLAYYAHWCQVARIHSSSRSTNETNAKQGKGEKQ